MKIQLIGTDRQTTDLAIESIRHRWPEMKALAATTATEGLGQAKQGCPDVVLLSSDVGDMRPPEAVRELRRFCRAPVLVLGHRLDPLEVVATMESGADDYVEMPCDFRDMTTRLWVLLRRQGPGA